MITQSEVRVDRFEVRTFRRTPVDAVRILREIGYHVTDVAEQILLTMVPTSGETRKIAVVRSESFMKGLPNYESCWPADVEAYAASQQYVPASVEDGWILREIVSPRMLESLGDRVIIMVMHEPVMVGGKPYRLTIRKGLDCHLLHGEESGPNHQYGPMWGFAYRAP